MCLHKSHQAFIEAHTMKTDFHTCTFMESEVLLMEENVN